MGADFKDKSLSVLIDLMIEKKVKIMELEQMEDRVAVTVHDDPPVKLSSPRDSLYSEKREYEQIKEEIDRRVQEYQK